MLRDIVAGQKGTAVVMVKECTEAVTTRNSPYWSLTLQDCSGTLDAKRWDIPLGTTPLSAGDVVQVIYEASLYKDAVQLKINGVTILDKDSVDLTKLVPTSKYDVGGMLEKVDALIASVTDPDYSRLLRKLLGEGSDKRKQFCEASAAEKVHHAFYGGLLQHSLFVARIVFSICKLYPGVNRDLAVTAALLHDYGKLTELSGFPEFARTPEYALYGHITLGAIQITEAIREFDNFPKQKEQMLIHCVLAHHGQLEWGSPVKPVTVEAMIVSMADNCDSKVEIMLETLDTPGYKDVGVYNKYLASSVLKTTGGNNDNSNIVGE